MAEKLKIVFMGTPDFSVPCLHALAKSGHRVQAVFTQPDKPKGRGYKLIPTPVKAAARIPAKAAARTPVKTNIWLNRRKRM